MRRAWHLIRLFINLVRVAGNPKNTAVALTMTERLRDLGLLQRELAKISSHPESLVVIAQRKLISEIDLQKLQGMPEGSLGKIYSSHMLSHGLDPEFYKILEIKDGVTFCMMRLRQTHDLWHTMTGFDTSVPGELGLQAFMLAQTNSPLPPLLIGGRLFAAAIKNPPEVPQIIESVVRGWGLGRAAKPLFPVDWERHWQTPLLEMQKRYGILNPL